MDTASGAKIGTLKRALRRTMVSAVVAHGSLHATVGEELPFDVAVLNVEGCSRGKVAAQNHHGLRVCSGRRVAGLPVTPTRGRSR